MQKDSAVDEMVKTSFNFYVVSFLSLEFIWHLQVLSMKKTQQLLPMSVSLQLELLLMLILQ